MPSGVTHKLLGRTVHLGPVAQACNNERLTNHFRYALGCTIEGVSYKDGDGFTVLCRNADGETMMCSLSYLLLEEERS